MSGLTWLIWMADVAAHNASVALTGGGERHLYRQRPKVLVEDDGKIIALFGGVMPCGERVIRPQARSGELEHCTSEHPPPNPHRRLGGTEIMGPVGRDNSWTSVVPLATAASRRHDRMQALPT
jgi:hypothetical protein